MSSSYGIIINNCNFISINLSYCLFDVSSSQMYLLNVTLYKIIAQFSFVSNLYDSSIYIDFLRYHLNSNGFLSIQNCNTSIKNSGFNNVGFEVSSQILDSRSLLLFGSNDNYYEILIKNSTFAGFYAKSNGSVIYFNYFDAFVEIYNCSFINNSVIEYGGAIYLYRSGNITILSCEFIGNSADFGGSIYYEDTDQINVYIYLSLISNLFQWNRASMAGGALMFFKKLPLNFNSNSNNNTFILNKAEAYGNDYASEPYRIFFLENENFQEKYEIEKLREIPFFSLKTSSGISIPPLLRFAIVDAFYQTVNRSFKEYCI